MNSCFGENIPDAQFYYEERAKQPIAYEKLKYGEYTPFGIDMAIEWHSSANVLAQLFKKDEHVSPDVREAFKLLTGCFAQCGKPSIGIIARKTFDDNSGIVSIGDAIASEVYVDGTQTIPVFPKSVKEEARNFIQEITSSVAPGVENVDLYKPVVAKFDFEHPENTKREWNNLVWFEGLALQKKIHPTDIDLFLNYGNKAVVIGELKRAGTNNNTGQNLLIGRFTEWFFKMGIPAIGIFAEHNVSDPHQPVDFGQCAVRYYYMNGMQLPEDKKRWPGMDQYQPFYTKKQARGLIDVFLARVPQFYDKLDDLATGT